MKNLKQLLIILFILTSTFTFSQTNSIKTDEQPYIEITGTAEKEIIPDEIYINITIKEKYVKQVKVTIEEQEEKLKIAVKSIGIDLKNLYLSDANADFVRIYWLKKDVLTKKEYILKVSDATTVGKVFQELDKLEIKDALISKVSHSKIDSLRKEIKIMAIKAAKQKADYLLAAIGEQTGKPLIIKENEVSSPITTMYGRSAPNVNTYIQLNDKISNEAEDEIDFQKINIQASIYVKFSIK